MDDSDYVESEGTDVGIASTVPADFLGEERKRMHALALAFKMFGVDCLIEQSVFHEFVQGLPFPRITAHSMTLCDGFAVDSLAWQYVIVQLLKVPKGEKVSPSYASEILERLNVWHILNKRVELCCDYAEKFGKKAHLYGDGVFIYHATKDMPKIHFCKTKKRFIRVFDKKEQDIAECCNEVYNLRYRLLLERTRQSGSMILSTDSRSISDYSPVKRTVLVPADAISFSSEECQSVIGTLGINKQGDLCVQGALSEIAISLDPSCVVSTGIYCEGNTVIVQGRMLCREGLFKVFSLSHPPLGIKLTPYAECSDFFGGELHPEDLVALQEYINLNADAANTPVSQVLWVTIAHPSLDIPDTICLLEKVFDGLIGSYEHNPLPAGFVFMGNFCSKKFAFYSENCYEWDRSNPKVSAAGETLAYERGFQNLYTLLTRPKYRLVVQNCYFVFVPGPCDATLCRSIIPVQPLLQSFTARFRERMENAIPGIEKKIVMATNPCRIRHWGRRMIFCRVDLAQRLVSRSLAASSLSPTNENLAPAVVETIAGQGHIFPGLAGRDTVLQHDVGLLLHPLPDLVCLADTTTPSFLRKSYNCTFANIAMDFHKTRSFLSYDIVGNRAYVSSI